MKEKCVKISQIMFAIAAFVLVLGMGKVNAKAASVKQTDQTQTSVTFNMDLAGYSDKYNTLKTISLGYSEDIETARNNAKAGQVPLTTSTRSYTINGLNPGSGVWAYVYVTYNNKIGGAREALFGTQLKCLPGVVTGLNQEQWFRLALSVYINWDKQSGVDGYEYRFMDDDGKDIDYSTTRTPRINEKIKNNQVYKGTVRAYTEINGTKYYSDWCPTAFFMTQPAKAAGKYGEYRELDCKVSGGKLKVSWEKVKGINQYEVYVATKKGGAFKKVKTVGANKKSVSIKKIGKKKIKGNKTYYVYVKGIKNVNGNTYTTGLNYITSVKKKATSCIYADTWK